MLVAAALVPPTGLLVPGVAGRADVLAGERAAALAAVRAVLAQGPERVVVLRDRGTDADLDAPEVGTLLAAGVPDDAWRPTATADEAPATADVPAAVGSWLLAQAGWTGEVLVRAVAGRAVTDLVRQVGAEAGDPRHVALLLVGGASVRRGPDAPLADDPQAEGVDARLVAWLRGLGDPDPGSAAGRPRVDPPDDEAVAWHGLDAVGPARVLAAALGGSGLVPAVTATVPLGATYLVATWLPGDAAGTSA